MQRLGPQPASPTDPRSGTTTALGVLSMVFGSIGVAWNLLAVLVSTVFAHHPLAAALGLAEPLGAFNRFQLIDACFKVPSAIVLIVVGLGLYRQREWSRGWAIGWAIGALLVLAVTIAIRILILSVSPPILPVVVLASYPIVVLVLLLREPATTVATRPPPMQRQGQGQAQGQGQGLPAWAWVLITLGGVGILFFGGCMVCTTVGAVGTISVVEGVTRGLAGAGRHAGAPGATSPMTPPPAVPMIRPPAPPVPKAPIAPIAPTATTVSPVSPTNVALATLLADYNDDEGRADGLYKGKLLRTRGKVKDVPRGVAGRVFFTLGTGAGVEINTVQCNVRASNPAPSSGLTVGTSLTVQGSCAGRDLTHIMLDDCSFVR